MRDPERIDKFCAELAEQWKKYPDFRFGQMIDNVVSSAGYCDMFYIEDKYMMELIKEFFKEY